MRVIVTGSNGLLGQTLVNLLLKDKDTYQVFGLSRGENRSERDDFSYHSVDITNQKKLEGVMTIIQPDVIVNTAAMTHVDVCEDNKEACDLLNVEAIRSLVDHCKKIKHI